MKLLLIDNYDSFTFNLLDYFAQLGAECVVVRNDEVPLDRLGPEHYTGIVISPGPKTPSEAGVTMQVIEQHHRDMPILGICLGHQALGQYFGANLVRAPKPVHGKTSTVRLSEHPLFAGLPATIEVMRYHSLILEPGPFFEMDVVGRSDDGVIMAIAHPLLPLAGLQFHPESILTTEGLNILRNWLVYYVARRPVAGPLTG